MGTRAARTYEDVRTGIHHIFSDYLTLFPSGGREADYAHHTLAKTETVYLKNVRAKVAMDFT